MGKAVVLGARRGILRSGSGINRGLIDGVDDITWSAHERLPVSDRDSSESERSWQRGCLTQPVSSHQRLDEYSAVCRNSLAASIK